MKTSTKGSYLNLLVSRARALETARTPRTIQAIHNHGSLTQAVEATTRFREQEARDAASHILAARDPLLAYAEQANNVPVSTLNYILSNHSMEYFARKYLPHVFDAPFSRRLHGVMLPVLYRATHSITRTPIVIAGWRECGKSVCASLLAPIHGNIFRAVRVLPGGRVVSMAKEYVMFLSLIKGGARKALRGVQYEYETNEGIRRDFGEFYFINGRKPDLWNKSEFLSPTGVYYEAMSRFTSLRGARERHRRPDFPIVDDVEDTRLSQNSPDRRAADMRWFTHEFIPAVSTTKGTPVLLGNFAYPGCLAMKLAEHGVKNGWRVLVFRVRTQDENGNDVYTWRAKFGPDFEAQRKKDLVFESAWQTEYQLNPTTARSELTEADFDGYDLNWFVAERLRYCRVYMALDPAIGTRATADKTAFVPIALDPANGHRYVLPIINERGLSLDEIVDYFVALYLKYHPRIARVGVESVGFQRALKANIEAAFARQGMSVNVHGITQGSRDDKRGRIRRTWPAIKRKEIHFLRDDVQHVEMISQIVNETSDHDDAADAFEMADRLILDEAADAAKTKQYGSVRARALTRASMRKGDTESPREKRGN